MRARVVLFVTGDAQPPHLRRGRTVTILCYCAASCSVLLGHTLFVYSPLRPSHMELAHHPDGRGRSLHGCMVRVYRDRIN